MNKFTLLPLLLVVSAAAAAAAEPPRSIVLILADDLGWADTTLYGKTSLYETPNIQRLAARGMTFTNAYAASPICSPTRASIMSGQNPARHGITSPSAHLPEVLFDPIASKSGPPHQKSTNVKSATRLDPSFPTLGKMLKSAGYATTHFGKWHLGLEPHSPLEHGFDVDIPHWHGPGPKTGYLAPWNYPNLKEKAPGEHIEDRMAEEAVSWLKKRDRSKPFFLNYWQFSVHAPFGAKPELIDRYRQKLGNPKREQGTVREDRNQAKSLANASGYHPEQNAQKSATYAAMVHSLDDAVGSLLEALDAEGIADETVIVFYSDNGGNIHCGLEETDASGENYIAAITSNHPLRGGKGGIHEGGIRVPAVVVWPGVTKPGSRSDVRIQSTDLYPTILGMLNVQRPQDRVIDGVDFAKALRGEFVDRGPMFTLVPGHGNVPQWLPPSMSVHHEDWKLIRTFYYGEDGNHDYRLYNLREDVGENKNLAGDHPEKVKALDKLIEDYIAAAKVVVPLPNPNFDLAKFDPSTIGVQAGGLKMPSSPETPEEAGQASFEFRETFDDFDPARFQTIIPNKNTQVRNGVLWTRGESGGKYPPMVYLDVEGKDLEISFRYRHLENDGMVWFFVDGDDGFGSVDHMLRVKLNRTGVQLQIDAHSLDPNHPDRQNGERPADKVSGAYRLNEKLPLEDVDLSDNVWRQVKLVFQGDTVTITVDGERWSTTTQHACFNAAKRKLLWMQQGGDKGIEIDDIKVTEVAGHVSKPE